jgi:DNA-binding winged helix-turn-helix (wHTH) protein
MNGPPKRPSLAQEPDFNVGPLRVMPSMSRVLADGIEHHAEAQTIALLIILTRTADATVSRDHLVQSCWQGRVVSDDAIARAIAKVRALARLTTPAAFELQTVPKVGYRLRARTETAYPKPHSGPKAISPLAGAFACISLIAILAGGAEAIFPRLPAQGDLVESAFTPAILSVDVVDALLNLDEDRLQTYIAQGWSPNWRLDSESNAALHTLMLACERNPTHDRAAVARTARLLVEAGADPFEENGWGDTPLEIASSDRYCGPDHPVVTFLRERTSPTN